MFETCVIRGREFAPARFCAPMAGYSHSAFRRLLASFGGCGAVWTEMLASRQTLSENFATSPWLRRRAGEPFTVFQLMAAAGDPLERILHRMGEHGVEAVDLNLACDALSARARSAGSALFDNFAALRRVVTEARRHWPGLLLAKIRLGARRPEWEAGFTERLRLLADVGVDGVTLHPRFFEDKFRGRARPELIPWAASLTSLPLIANGDLGGRQQVEAHAGSLAPAAAVMIGRMALARPWLFAAWEKPVAVDLAAIWRQAGGFIEEDFPAPTAVRRVQMFTKYFAANFAFGHQFRVAIANAPSLAAIRERAEIFFATSPALVADPTVAGL